MNTMQLLVLNIEIKHVSFIYHQIFDIGSIPFLLDSNKGERWEVFFERCFSRGDLLRFSERCCLVLQDLAEIIENICK